MKAGYSSSRKIQKAVPLFMVCILLLLAVSGCSRTPPTPTTSPDHPILFAMDFEEPSAFAGWQVGAPGVGPFRLENTRAGKYVAEYPSGYLENEFLQFPDVEISADTAFKSTARVDVGVVCRLQQGEGYRFTIANDGQWSILKWYQGGESVLAGGWSAVIKSDQNRLAGRCTGRDLTLLVDGVEIGSAQDGSLFTGGIGLMYNAEKEGAAVFDNLQVTSWPAPAAAGPQTAKRTVAPPAASAQPSATATIAATATSAPTATATLVPSPTAVPTAAATLRPTRIPDEDLTLYQTHFEENDRSLADWQTFAYAPAAQALQSDGYRTYVTASYIHYYVNNADANINLRLYSIYTPDLGTPDVELSLRTTLLPMSYVGLVCRYNPAGWYQFMYEPGGWAILRVMVDDAGAYHFQRLSSAEYGWGPSAYNTDLRAECKGSRLTLYVDGEEKASLLDDTFATGQVGVLAWGFLNTGEIGLIDSFTASRAQWSESSAPGPAPTPGADGSLYTIDFYRLGAMQQHWYAFDPADRDAPYTRYLNDFDPGSGDVQLTAGMAGGTFERALICRYTQDGWYELRYRQLVNATEVLNLFRLERDAGGFLRQFHLGGAELSPRSPRTVTLTCAGSHLSGALDGEVVIQAQDARWSSGRYGFGIQLPASTSIKAAFTSFTVLPATVPPGQAVQQPAPLANQLNLPAYAPGETIYTWALPDFLGQGDPLSPALSLWYAGDPPSEADGAATVTSRRLPVVWAFSRDLYDLPVELNAEATFNAATGSLGLFCRASSLGRYEFLIQPDGKWYIRRNLSSWDDPVAAAIEILANGKSSAILPAANQFSATCSGSQLIFSANGSELGRAQDDLLPEGQAGLFFDAYTAGSVNYLNIIRAQ